VRSHGSTRREVLALASVASLSVACPAAASAAEPVDERPREGDELVATDAATPVALKPDDVAGGATVIAWPRDSASGVVRSGSRLNKVLLLRIEPGALVGATRERAAGGIVAYSAICPHAGCEVTDWHAAEHILECPCHNSRYNPCDAAAIVEGPTTRALAALPLRIGDGKLVVAKPFVGRVGIVQT
jgi:Rieske Fe-S protein